MNTSESTAAALIDLIRARAPGFLDLLTAKTETEFDEALDSMIGATLIHLEANSANFAKLGEVELTAAFAGKLSIPGITVTQETHSNGHVDITITQNYSSPPQVRLGEAKLYGGYVYHAKGLEQLVGRYATGRSGRGLMLIYYRNKNIQAAIKTLREEMDSKLPLSQIEKTTDGALKWSFFSKHQHSSGSGVEVAHYGCNMYNPIGGEAPAPLNGPEKKDTPDGT